ncbi:MAG: GtrA family protein [Terriglobales bacterium]
MKKSSQFPVLSSQKSQARLGFLRWLKFNFVGGIGIAVQLAALAFCRSILQLDYLLATALAVELAVIHNFAWHERFTWRDRPVLGVGRSLARFGRFNTTNGAISLAGNLLVMRGLVGQWHLNLMLANVIAVAVCSVVNFLVSDRLVFQRAKEKLRSEENLIRSA